MGCERNVCPIAAFCPCGVHSPASANRGCGKDKPFHAPLPPMTGQNTFAREKDLRLRQCESRVGPAYCPA